MFIVLVIQHEMRKHRVKLSPVAFLALTYLTSHKRHEFGQKLLNTKSAEKKCILIFSTFFSRYTSHYKKDSVGYYYARTNAFMWYNRYFIIVQRDASISSLVTEGSLCMFRVSSHPLSGVHKTLTTASGSGQMPIIGAATSFQRDQVGHAGMR